MSGDRGALKRHGEVGVVVGHRVHHETVDAGVEDRVRSLGDAAARPDSDQQQTLSYLFTRFRKPCNTTHCGRIAERIVERLGEHQAHRPGLAGSQ